MTDPASKWENLVIDNDGRLIDLGGPLEVVDFGPPPPVVWIPVMDHGNVFDRRVAVFIGKPTYDLRLASDVFEDACGWYVLVVGEDQWWDWVSISEHQRPPKPPRAVCVQARYVWVETHQHWTPPSGDKQRITKKEDE